ncbi:MAG TPA: GNAT family N-acetyltransferase [Gammaproteobacteria bacterium]|nr:GNAT family N-acetyltransferase [Gammaproteobacteria bacterium]
MPVPAVQVREPGQLGPAQVERWAALADEALEPNVYLSPDFVLPALRYLTPDATPLVVTVASAGSPGFAALGVFRQVARSRRFPLPHLAAYASRHSFLTGLLVAPGEAPEALEALFGFVASRSNRWHGFAFRELDAGGALGRALMNAAAASGARWVEHAHIERAFLSESDLARQPVVTHTGRTRRELTRKERRLREAGAFEWRLLEGGAVDDAAISRFVDLEHCGWKGERGSSLQSRARDQAFFEEVVRRLRRRGDAFFTELLCDGRVIASTSNFLSGGAGFAFKIGWDTAFRKFSPGLMNEVLLLREGEGFLRGLRFLDSGADEGSFLESLWPGRRRLSTGVFATSTLGRAALAGVGLARTVRRQGRAMRRSA